MMEMRHRKLFPGWEHPLRAAGKEVPIAGYMSYDRKQDQFTMTILARRFANVTRWAVWCRENIRSRKSQTVFHTLSG